MSDDDFEDGDDGFDFGDDMWGPGDFDSDDEEYEDDFFAQNGYYPWEGDQAFDDDIFGDLDDGEEEFGGDDDMSAEPPALLAVQALLSAQRDEELSAAPPAPTFLRAKASSIFIRFPENSRGGKQQVSKLTIGVAKAGPADPFAPKNKPGTMSDASPNAATLKQAQIQGLAPGTLYVFRITVENAAGKSVGAVSAPMLAGPAGWMTEVPPAAPKGNKYWYVIDGSLLKWFTNVDMKDEVGFFHLFKLKSITYVPGKDGQARVFSLLLKTGEKITLQCESSDPNLTTHDYTTGWMSAIQHALAGMREAAGKKEGRRASIQAAKRKKPALTKKYDGKTFGTQADMPRKIQIYIFGDQNGNRTKTIVLNGAIKTFDQVMKKLPVTGQGPAAKLQLVAQDLRTNINTMEKFKDGGQYLALIKGQKIPKNPDGTYVMEGVPDTFEYIKKEIDCKVDYAKVKAMYPNVTKKDTNACVVQFNIYDANGDQKIDQNEITSSFVQLGIDATEDEVKDLLIEFDADNSGTLDIFEYIGVFAKYKAKDASVGAIGNGPSEACAVM